MKLTNIILLATCVLLLNTFAYGQNEQKSPISFTPKVGVSEANALNNVNAANIQQQQQQTQTTQDQQLPSTSPGVAAASASDGIIDVNQNVISHSHTGAPAPPLSLPIDGTVIDSAIKKEQEEGQKRLEYRILQMQQEEQRKQVHSVDRDKLNAEQRVKYDDNLKNKDIKIQQRVTEETQKQSVERTKITAEAVEQQKADLVEIAKEEAYKLSQMTKQREEWKEEVRQRSAKSTEQMEKAEVADKMNSKEEQDKAQATEADFKRREQQYNEAVNERKAQEKEENQQIVTDEQRAKQEAKNNEKAYEERMKAEEPKQKKREEEQHKERQQQQQRADEAATKANEQREKQGKEQNDKSTAAGEASFKQGQQNHLNARNANEQRQKADAEQGYRNQINQENAREANPNAPNLPHHRPWFCFAPSTPIIMADGTLKPIDQIKIGDATLGGAVTGVMMFELANSVLYNYKGVVVSGVHKVLEDGVFMEVADSKHARPYTKADKPAYLYDFDSTRHRIFIASPLVHNLNITFADFSEVDLIPEVERLELQQLNDNLRSEERL